MPPQTEALQHQNLHFFACAVRALADGDAVGVRRLGLSDRHIPHLRQLSIAQLADLAHHGVELPTYLRTVTGQSDDQALRTALIRHGAPRDLMMEVFGMTTRRYSSERIRLGVAGVRGRPATNSTGKSAEHRLWHLWVLLAQPHHPARLRQADHWLLIALELPGQLRAAWSLIQQWAQEAVSRRVLAWDRARFTPKQLLQAEDALRQKHGLQVARIEAGSARHAGEITRESDGTPARASAGALP